MISFGYLLIVLIRYVFEKFLLHQDVRSGRRLVQLLLMCKFLILVRFTSDQMCFPSDDLHG